MSHWKQSNVKIVNVSRELRGRPRRPLATAECLLQCIVNMHEAGALHSCEPILRRFLDPSLSSGSATTRKRPGLDKLINKEKDLLSGNSLPRWQYNLKDSVEMRASFKPRKGNRHTMKRFGSQPRLGYQVHFSWLCSPTRTASRPF